MPNHDDIKFLHSKMILLIENLKWSLFYRSEGRPWVVAGQSLNLQTNVFVIKIMFEIIIMKVEVMKIMMAIRARLLLTSPVQKRINKNLLHRRTTRGNSTTSRILI